MMIRFLFVVISSCAALSVVRAGLLEDVVRPPGLDLGNGLTLHLQNRNKRNGTFLERHTLRMDYGGYGVSVGKAASREAVEVGLYVNDLSEGRGKKDKDMSMSMLLGYKLAMIVSTILAVMGALVLKALGVAKFALFTAGALFISKLFHHHEEPQHHYRHTPEYIEVEATEEHAQSAPELISAQGGEYHPSASANNYYAYNSYIPSGTAADNSMSYATLDAGAAAAASAANASLAGNQQVAVVARRRDQGRKNKKTTPAITIHRYTFGS